MTVSNSLQAPAASENRSSGRPRIGEFRARNDETIESFVARGEQRPSVHDTVAKGSTVVFHQHQIAGCFIKVRI